MIRLTGRLARPNILASAALLAAVAMFAVLTRNVMSAYIDHSGLGACLASNGNCDDLVHAFTNKFGNLITAHTWVSLVPMLVGVFWGAPLMAREIEEGTHRLAWTQTVSRGRWLATKLAFYLSASLLIAAALTALMTWWFQPIEQIRDHGITVFSRLSTEVFDFRGIVPLAYTLFAFAVGMAAGTFFKRSIAAIGVTIVVYIPFRFILQSLRGHLLAPFTQTYPFGTVSPRAGLGDWLMQHKIMDSAGNVYDNIGVPVACSTSLADRASLDACIAAQGYTFVDTYQPLSRFWPLQLIESGIYVSVSAVLLGAAAWWIIRRVA
jgi:ABC-type transport system involved in multi-copper enzyme maturation permease subunit